MTMRSGLSAVTGGLLWLALLAGPSSASEPAQGIPNADPFQFASQAQARQLLTSPDRWFRSVRAAQLASLHPDPTSLTTEDQIRPLFAQIARPCDEQQQQRWRPAFANAWTFMRERRMALPETVFLICSTGLDAPASPYTRQNFIVLPKDFPDAGPMADRQLAAHELFHVFSRHHGPRMDRIYKIFNFFPIQPFLWLEEWRTWRISNPDAPDNRYAIALDNHGVLQKYVPVLVARKMPDGQKQTFLDVLEVRLVPVIEGDTASTAKWVHGEIPWIDAMRSQAYHQATGGNTSYVLHPEEVAADNFSFLVSGKTVPHPELLRQLDSALQTLQ